MPVFEPEGFPSALTFGEGQIGLDEFFGSAFLV
jgi:hypothetical protein